MTLKFVMILTKKTIILIFIYLVLVLRIAHALNHIIFITVSIYKLIYH